MASIGSQPSRIHNNCSGKHIAMLLMCKFFGFSTDMYFDRNHELQKLIFKYLSNLFNTKIENIAIDGCSTPIPYLNSKILVDSANELAKGHGKDSLAWNKIIYASEIYFQSQINRHKINVENILDNSVGVAEHSDIMTTIEKELEQMAHYQDLLDMIKTFND